MSKNLLDQSPEGLARRKQELLAAGAQYRSAIDASRKVINDNLHADELARSVVNHRPEMSIQRYATSLTQRVGD